VEGGSRYAPPGEIVAIPVPAAERFYTEMASNMVKHMVAPLNHPIRLRTGVPVAGVPRGSTARALFVAFTALMRHRVVEGLQFFSRDIAPLAELGRGEDLDDVLLVGGVGILDDPLLLGGEVREHLGRESSLRGRGCPLSQRGRARNVGSTRRIP
jgi:hypothetical protein